jgi:ribosomal-protein-alanine N-acetyltransferase
MKIRLAHESDIPQLIAISETAESAAHWTQRQWLDIFRNQMPARRAWIAERVAEDDERAVGFLVAQSSGPDWELENIAVLPNLRRQGVGLALVVVLLAQARALLAERILLEVRASNQSAIDFYGKCGFQVLARRPAYYRNPDESALILGHSFQY